MTAAEAKPRPPLASMFEDVYAGGAALPKHLREQLAAHEGFVARSAQGAAAAGKA